MNPSPSATVVQTPAVTAAYRLAGMSSPDDLREVSGLRFRARVSTWFLHMVPYLLYRVLKPRPLGFIW